MVAERAVKICHAHSAQTPHKHCEYSVLSEKNGPRIGSVIPEHYLERDNYLHMALEGPKRRKGRRKLCWKAWVVFKICAWLANYFLLSGPSNRRGTCSRPAHRLLHKTKSDHSGCSYASQNSRIYHDRANSSIMATWRGSCVWVCRAPGDCLHTQAQEPGSFAFVEDACFNHYIATLYMLNVYRHFHTHFYLSIESWIHRNESQGPTILYC